MVFGVLAGYALAMLHFRGRGTVFFTLLLVLVVPFQLLMIPLYVLIARDYGLGDSYIGMILPFAINSTAVFIFRQYFTQLPPELFQAARIDGAGELRTLWSVALPLVRPALLTAVLLTFIGPWNEFLWPFLITKQQSKQPLAVSLANYITTVQTTTTANPYGAILAGACVLAIPRSRPVPDLPTAFRLDRSRFGREGLMTVQVDSPIDNAVPYVLRRMGVVMTPDLTDPNEVDGVLNPGSGRDPAGRLYLLPRIVAAGNVSRIGLARVVITDGVPVGVEREGVVLEPDAGWERAKTHAGVEDPRITWIPALNVHVMTYVAYGPLGPRPCLAVSSDLHSWRRLGPVHFGYQEGLDADLNHFTNKDVVSSPSRFRVPAGRCISRRCTVRPGTSMSWRRGSAPTCRPGSVTIGQGSGSPTFRWTRLSRMSLD